MVKHNDNNCVFFFKMKCGSTRASGKKGVNLIISYVLEHHLAIFEGYGF